MTQCTHTDQINQVTPSADGCEECLKMGDSWVHLRMCLTCGHISSRVPLRLTSDGANAPASRSDFAPIGAVGRSSAVTLLKTNTLENISRVKNIRSSNLLNQMKIGDGAMQIKLTSIN